MDTPQTERETVNEELGMFDPQRYKDALLLLTHEQLREECFKQYELSGEYLNKYRIETNRSRGYKNQRDAAWSKMENMTRALRHYIEKSQSALEAIAACKVVMNEVQYSSRDNIASAWDVSTALLDRARDRVSYVATQLGIEISVNGREDSSIPF